MNYKLSWWILGLIFFSCAGSKKLVKEPATTGRVNYAIQVFPKDDVPVTAESFGDKATVHFNEKYIHFKKNNGQGAEDNFQLIEVASGTERNDLNFRGKKYLLTTTPDMLPEMGELIFHDEKKEILGIECQRATAKMGEGEVEAWFTKAINVDFCPYIPAKGFALQYSLPMPFGKVVYKATALNLNEKNPSLLIPPTDYKKVTMMELQREIAGRSPDSFPQIEKESIAPNFIAKNLNGKLIDLNSLKGKVVLLNFWFINCAPCRTEMPDLNELKKEYANNKDVVFIAITFDKEAAVKKFLQKTTFDFQIIADAIPIIEEYMVEAFPTSIVIGKDGKVVDSKMGGSFNIKEELKVFIEKALK